MKLFMDYNIKILIKKLKNDGFLIRNKFLSKWDNYLWVKSLSISNGLTEEIWSWLKSEEKARFLV